jgi:hypothetical protein
MFSVNSFACLNPIDKSKVPTLVSDGPSAIEMSCPSGDCVCTDGIDVSLAAYVDNIVLDYVSKVGVVTCDTSIDMVDCDTKFAALTCSEGVAIKNYLLQEVYCAVGVMKADGKKLVVDEAKLAAKDAEKAARQVVKAAKIANREALKAELFALKKSEIDAMSVSQRNGVLFKLLNIVQDLQE